MAKQPKPTGMKPVTKMTREFKFIPNPKPVTGYPTTPERDSTSMPRLMMKSTSAPRKAVKTIATGMREGAEEAASAMRNSLPNTVAVGLVGGSSAMMAKKKKK